MQDLSIALVQADLVWENVDQNLKNFDQKIASINHSPQLIVLPELFSTGFSMHVEKNAEPENGAALSWMKSKAKEKNCVLAGSLLIKEDGKFYNRFIWMQADGNYETYDKRHLFSMAGEHTIMTAGKENKIVSLAGWKISLQVCYDLRFPVWSKNFYDDGHYAFDILLYVANWPEVRKSAYSSLLLARAIENSCYVVWNNRVGADGKNIFHSGDSAVIDPKGNTLALATPGEEQVLNVVLSAEALQEYRQKFQVGPDWDLFEIQS